VAWCVPSPATSAGTVDGYATTPVVVHSVVYTQDLEPNVMAIRLATGKVLWTHTYNSPNGSPDGVTVVGGTVYAATDSAAVALIAALEDSLRLHRHQPGTLPGDQLLRGAAAQQAPGLVLRGGDVSGYLYAFNAATGAILLKTPLSAATNNGKLPDTVGS
jgi:outer membrane protein assembly factor BamB